MTREITNLTLEDLLNKQVNWMKKEEDSYLIVTCNNLHKKVLSEFTIEDLRILIGQNIGLVFLVPMALKELENNILAEGDFYPGDLLKSVLRSDSKFWKRDQQKWNTLVELYSSKRQFIQESVWSESDYTQLEEVFQAFKKINP